MTGVCQIISTRVRHRIGKTTRELPRAYGCRCERQTGLGRAPRPTNPQPGRRRGGEAYSDFARRSNSPPFGVM